MRFLQPVFVFLTVAAFHSALSASLESAEKEEKVPQYDGLTELQKIDQIEFEAAQKRETTQINGTDTERSEDVHYLEAAQDESEEERAEPEVDSTEGGGHSDAAAREETVSESSEEVEGRQKHEHHDAVSSLDAEVNEESSEEQGVNLANVFYM
uniref:cilia- and flagella-associated protein 251-like isoform X1 n=1 Tax=Solea senegalensis TaxID=28829 RepID=UPI001CD87725|nr:cilia- and flagella-associated protein 251-like isoform X1 [Solea senegalensis]